jgi:hypothetical protein
MKAQSFIHPNAKLRLVNVKLSQNPDAKVENFADGIDGKINVGEDGRQYYIAEFEDPENFLAPTRTKVLSQSSSPSGENQWRVPNPKKLRTFMGKEVPAAIITRFVEPYVVGERTVDTYTTIVLRGEIIEQVFQRAGHIIVGVTADENVPTGADAFEMN